MKCPRCKGKLFKDKYYEFVKSFMALKCINCGELIDTTILANRQKSLPPEAIIVDKRSTQDCWQSKFQIGA